MSKAKKISLALVLALAAAAGGKYYRDGTPYLVGKCYGFADRTTLALVDVATVKNKESKMETGYVGIIGVGPLQFPQLLSIRATNAMIPEWKKSNQAYEADCKTWAPANAK